MPTSSPSLSSQLNLVFANITKKTVIGMEQGLLMSATMLKNVAVGIAPKHIGQHIQISPVQSTPSMNVPASENYREVKIFVKIADAPDAAAWEYGSGIHDPNTPHLIPIAAKNAGMLVFWWANRGKWFKGKALPIGHPGIKMRSYLRQSLLDNREAIRQRIAQSIQEANNV
jgi:hypothetical protein